MRKNLKNPESGPDPTNERRSVKEFFGIAILGLTRYPREDHNFSSMTETLGGPSPESGEGKTPERTEDSKRAQRERKKQRKREERRQRALESRRGTTGTPPAPDVSTPPAPAPDSAPTIATPDTRPAADPVAPPDVVVVPPPDLHRLSLDDEDDDASVAAPSPVPLAPPMTPPDVASFDLGATDPDAPDLHYVFLPGEKGIDDKAVGALKKAGRGLGFAGVGVLGLLGHGVRITAKKTHHAVDGLLYVLEKWMYDHSGSKTTIPWKWFTKEPEEPEYQKAKKRAEELIKRGTGKEKKK